MLVVISFTGSPPASDGFLLGLLSDPEDGDHIFLQNLGETSLDQTVLHSITYNSSLTYIKMDENIIETFEHLQKQMLQIQTPLCFDSLCKCVFYIHHLL
jgi:hypothetical protein